MIPEEYFFTARFVKSKFFSSLLEQNFCANLNSIKLQLFCIMFEKIKQREKGGIERDEKWTSNRHLQSKSEAEYQMQKKEIIVMEKIWIYKFSFDYPLNFLAAHRSKNSFAFNNNRLWRGKISILNSIMYFHFTVPFSRNFDNFKAHPQQMLFLWRKTVKCTQ